MPTSNKKSIENWNERVLLTEELILTISPEEAIHNEKMTKLVADYQQGINKEIAIFKEDKELEEILNIRREAMEKFSQLKIALASEPTGKEKNEDYQIKNILLLTDRLAVHCQYIRANHDLLEKKQAAEKHLLPHFFNLLADAFDYLATLQWNTINSKPKNERFKTIVNVLRAYKNSIYCLHEEKKSSNQRYVTACEKKINHAIQLVKDTYDEVAKLSNELELSRELFKNFMNFREPLINFLRKPPADSLEHLFGLEKLQTFKRKLSEPLIITKFFKYSKNLDESESVNIEKTNVHTIR